MPKRPRHLWTTRERQADNRRKHLAWRRKRLLAIQKLGGCCARCGETDPVVLELDHVNGDGDQHRPSKGYGGPQNKATIRQILAGNGPAMQVLCANCHRRKTYTHGDYRPSTAGEQQQILFLEQNWDSEAS